MSTRRKKVRSRVATHRPAVRQRRFRHDDLVAVDLFSGFGGLTRGIEAAGFTTIMAANHNKYKTEVHEKNHPHAEHWIADLVDPESSDYHDARDLPAADILVAGVSCTNHSQANTQKAYEQGLSLFDVEDPEFEERVTRSERDRATANCVLHYGERQHPRMILVECTTELQSWGPAIPGKPKIGDGSTYRWWLRQHRNLNYRYKELYLNSQFFGVPQSRDRLYVVFWDRSIPDPDLEHRPLSWCDRCHEVLPAVWTWKTGIPLTGSVRYGKQYGYRCPRCRGEVIPPMAPAINALDLTDLGTRIGDKPHRKHRDGSTGPMARATLARADRCRQRFPEFPAVIMPAKAVHGTERHPWQPAVTQTSQQESALLSTGAVMVAAGNTFEREGSDCRTRDLGQPLWSQVATNTAGLVAPPVALAGHVIAAHRHNGDGQHITHPMDTVTATQEKALVVAAVNNFQGAPRGLGEAMPTQAGSETLSLVSTGVVPFRKNTVPTGSTQPMPTMTAEQTPGMLTAAGVIRNNGAIEEAQYRAHPVSDPLGTQVASSTGQSLLFSGWHEQNGTSPEETARDTAALLTAEAAAEWRAALAAISLEDCYFRMLAAHEVGAGCGFDTTFPGRPGTFIVWGSARDQVDGFGNAVSPPVGMWIGARLRAALHR